MHIFIDSRPLKFLVITQHWDLFYQDHSGGHSRFVDLTTHDRICACSKMLCTTCFFLNIHYIWSVNDAAENFISYILREYPFNQKSPTTKNL